MLVSFPQMAPGGVIPNLDQTQLNGLSIGLMQYMQGAANFNFSACSPLPPPLHELHIPRSLPAPRALEGEISSRGVAAG